MTETRKWRLALTSLGLASAFLYLYQLAHGQRSEYYAAIALSMSKNFSNFFFGALDPAGTVTLDKIPGSYWIPAIFVRIFGFSTWSVDAPNAIAGIATVIIAAITIKKLFGKTAGIIAGALVATTPIFTAVVRSNQPQTYFLLTLSLAALYATKAIENSSRRYLIITGAFIALAFHTYMLEAWALWPAVMIGYALTAQPASKKFKDILIAGFTSLALSMTWIFLVTLVPKSHRPYIGGTYHNNPIEMVFGYNGLGRFKGISKDLSNPNDNPIFRSFTPPFGGPAGLNRLFNDHVAGQIAWLIPAALIASLALFIYSKKRAIIAFYFAWLITFFIMFSVVAGIHQFYVSSLAFPIAALIAAAFAVARERDEFSIPIALLAVTALWTLKLSDRYTDYFSWAPKIQIALAAFALIIFAAKKSRLTFLLPIALIAGIAFTPTVWALDVRNRPSAINPIAGPDTGMNFGRPNFHGPMNGGPRPNFPPPSGRRPGDFGVQNNSELISYLTTHRGKSKFLLAAFGGLSAAPFITATGENVLPIGGFDGQDPTPTLKQFKAWVKSGDIKYVLAATGHGIRTNGKVEEWVLSNCTKDSNAPGATDLYYCKP